MLIEKHEGGDPAPGDGIEQAWGFQHFYDVSDPAAPALLADFRLPTSTQFPPPAPGEYTVHDPKVQGNRAYVSWYSEGVVVLDLADLRQPRKIAQFVPPPTRDPRGFWGLVFGTEQDPDPAFPFVWGVHVSGRTIVASDINSGLWVFELRRQSPAT